MNKKILIIDDDKDLSSIVKDFLDKNGFEVKIASDGSEGLRMLKTYVPDLILCDLNMPNLSGWHTTMKIRQDDRFKKTPIIVLSGLLERDAEAEKFDSANAYIVKPFDIFKLHEKIKELLNFTET